MKRQGLVLDSVSSLSFFPSLPSLALILHPFSMKIHLYLIAVIIFPLFFGTAKLNERMENP